MARKFSYSPFLALFAFSSGLALAGCAESNRGENSGGKDMKRPRDLTSTGGEEDLSSVDLRKPKPDLTGGSTTDEDLAEPGTDDGGTTGNDLAMATSDGGTTGSDMAASGSVTGVFNLFYILGDGTASTLPVNLSTASLTAYVPTASGFDPIGIDGTGKADGTFEIADVPAGPYYLEVLLGSQTPVYYVTDARTLDLSYALSGRADATYANTGTELQLYVNFPSGQTWDTSFSNLQLYSANAGAFAYSLDYVATAGKPAAAATKLSGMVTPYDDASTQAPWLVDNAKGDIAYLVLQSKKTAGGLDYITPTGAIAGVPGLTMAQGVRTGIGTSTTPLNMALVDSTTSTVSVTSWARQTFDAAFRTGTGAINLNATSRVQYLSIEAQPGGTTYGLVGPNPYVLDAYSQSNSEATPGTMAYGNPYPAEWALLGTAMSMFTVNIQLGSATAAEFTPSVFTMKPAASFGPSVTPLVGPVTAAKLDGTKDLSATQTGADPANTKLSWTAPTTGTAHFYEVWVYSLSTNLGATVYNPEARILTTSTSVTVPPAVLVNNKTYCFDIRAFHSPGSDIAAKPELRGATYGWADYVSAKVTTKP